MILLVERKELKQKKAQWMYPLRMQGVFLWRHVMLLKILSEKFFSSYADCRELLKKKNRPYACLTLELDGLLFAIPFRHHIRHPYAFHTIGEAGLDFTKAVIISNPDYLSADTPTIDSKEFSILKRNENKIRYDFSKYVRQYRRAMKHRDNPRSASLLRYSTLQYFEDLL